MSRSNARYAMDWGWWLTEFRRRQRHYADGRCVVCGDKDPIPNRVLCGAQACWDLLTLDPPNGSGRNGTGWRCSWCGSPVGLMSYHATSHATYPCELVCCPDCSTARRDKIPEHEPVQGALL